MAVRDLLWFFEEQGESRFLGPGQRQAGLGMTGALVRCSEWAARRQRTWLGTMYRAPTKIGGDDGSRNRNTCRAEARRYIQFSNAATGCAGRRRMLLSLAGDF